MPMRAKLPALLGLVTAALWIAAAALSWGHALDDTSTRLWWIGLGVFGIAAAFTGYAAVTDSPIWLRVVVFLSAGALGVSVLSVIDIDAAQSPTILGALGVGLVLIVLIAVMLGRRRIDEFDPPDRPPTDRRGGGRRAAR